MKIYAVIENEGSGYHVLYADTDSTRAHEKLNELIGAKREYSIANEIFLALQFRNEVLSREEAESYVGDCSYDYEIMEFELEDTEVLESNINMWIQETRRLNNENP